MTQSQKPNPENSKKAKERVTQPDIANALGISQMTVSLALRNHPRISQATRQRVQEKATEMGYKTDPMLSALTHYRLSKHEKIKNASLAWINPFRNPAQLHAQNEFKLYWKGAYEMADTFGFNLEEFTTSTLPLGRLDTILNKGLFPVGYSPR